MLNEHKIEKSRILKNKIIMRINEETIEQVFIIFLLGKNDKLIILIIICSFSLISTKIINKLIITKNNK